MPASKRRIKLISLLTLFVGMGILNTAHGFQVIHAETMLAEDKKIYQLNAELQHQFSNQIKDAISNGVPITVMLEMVVYRERSWMWDEDIATLKRRYEIRFQALTKKYLLKNINTGQETLINDFEGVLDILNRVKGFPLIDKNLLSDDETYYTLVRTRIDVEALSVPLRLRAYISSSWSSKSDWYTCSM